MIIDMQGYTKPIFSKTKLAEGETGSHLIIIISFDDDISLLQHPLRKSKLTPF
jgi:hypothetical protein